VSSVKVTDAVRLQRGVDIKTLPLGPQEGFILSRVEGRTIVRDLVASTGLGQEVVLDTVLHLIHLNVIHIDHTPVEDEDQKDVGMPEELPDELLHEQVELTPEQRLRIFQMEYTVNKRTHYDVLGLRRTATGQDIKRAYHEMSRDFHPDAFFRKDLGSFKPRLEKAFKAIKKAYDLLSNEAQRKEYDKNLPPEEAPKPKVVRHDPDKPRVVVPDWRNEPARVAEAEARRLKANPMVARVERGRRHFLKATEYYKAKQLAQAANEISLAVAQDPWSEELKKLHEQIQGDLKEERFTRLAAKVELLCSGGGTGGMDAASDLKEMEAAVKDAMDSQSSQAMPHFRMARALFKTGYKKLAKAPADRALKLMPEDEKTLMLMVDLLEDAQLIHNAVRTMEKAHQLHPAPDKEERLKRLRKTLEKMR